MCVSEALEADRSDILEVTVACRRGAADRADDHLTWIGLLLQTCGDVHTRADGHPLPFAYAVEIYEGLACFDSNANRKRFG
jgi:hypothetical protein